jgi:PAS domain S-box-containing protein
MAAPIPENEQERLQALREYQISRTPEEAFDEITRSAQQICDTPIALLSLVEEQSQWFKSKIGLDASETTRDVAFCAYAILQPDVLIVPDALNDERFADNPLVTSDPLIRFYAGAPLITPSGYEIGTLCVIDHVPRQINADQVTALEELSRRVVNLFQERRSKLATAVKVSRQQQKQRQQNRFLRRVAGGFGLVFAAITAIGTVSYWSTANIIASQQRVAHTFEVLATLEEITSDLKDAQIAAQNYVFKGDKPFLTSYNAAVADIRKDLVKVKELTADNLNQQQKIAVLNTLVGSKLSLLDQTIQKPKRQDLELAKQPTNQDSELTQRLNQVLLEMEREEQTLLQQRSENTGSSIHRANFIFLVGSLLMLAIVAAIYYRIYQEILRRRQTEDALEQQLDFTDTILNNAKALVMVLDRNGQILRTNLMCDQVTGYSSAEVKGKYVWDCFSTPEGIETIKADYAQPKAEQFPNQRECVWVTKNGDRRWINWSNTAVIDSQGQIEYIISTGIDITQRRQVEAERDRFFSLSPDLFCIASVDGYFKRLNPAWEKVLGWTVDELLTQHYLKLVHPDDRKATFQQARKLLADQEVISFENRYRCKDGSYCWLLWNVVLYYDKIYAVAHNITERKQVEEQTHRALAKEKELSELKSRFVSIVSHEFRTPLTIVLGSADLLGTSGSKLTVEKQKRYYSRIRSAVKRMTGLLEDVLVISSVEAGKLTCKPVPLNLEQFCRDLIAEFELIKDTQHTIIFVGPTTPNPVEGCMDPKLLHHIFTNLISNAIKYSPAGGTVRLELNYQEQSAVFRVQDQGIGIPSGDLNQLFTAFHRSSNVGTISGTGLGLSIVKTCVDLHGGAIVVDSKVGSGTTFTVNLPLALHSSLD